jgi:hypothetical protein
MEYLILNQRLRFKTTWNRVLYLQQEIQIRNSPDEFAHFATAQKLHKAYGI